MPAVDGEAGTPEIVTEFGRAPRDRERWNNGRRRSNRALAGARGGHLGFPGPAHCRWIDCPGVNCIAVTAGVDA